MLFGSVVPSHLRSLSLKQALELTNLYLENAYKIEDPDIALVLCHEAEAALSQGKSANKKLRAHQNDARHEALREGMATAYIDLGKLLEKRGYQGEGQAMCEKAEKW
ncbi:MAG: hypothetical protein J3Q66DRAFT_443682, partial [Benniella sp.]